jgi:uncharacterized protein (DUF302 family)
MLGEFSFEVKLNQPYQEALEFTKIALNNHGFGVLTSIDVKTTMKEKLDVDFRPYSILGACNPPLAHRALSQDASVGLILPCNVTVEAESKQTSIVRIANPEVVLSVAPAYEKVELTDVAKEARRLLELVAEELASI